MEMTQVGRGKADGWPRRWAGTKSDGKGLEGWNTRMLRVGMVAKVVGVL